MQTWTSAQATRLGLSDAAYAARFDALTLTLAKSLVVFFVPVIALLFGLLNWRSRRYALEHVTAALHYVSLLLLILPLPYPLVWAPVRLGWVDRSSIDVVWSAITALTLGVYAAWFLRRVYGGSVAATTVKAIAIVTGFYLALIFLYRPLLFFITYALL